MEREVSMAAGARDGEGEDVGERSFFKVRRFEPGIVEG